MIEQRLALDKPSAVLNLVRVGVKGHWPRDRARRFIGDEALDDRAPDAVKLPCALGEDVVVDGVLHQPFV